MNPTLIARKKSLIKPERRRSGRREAVEGQGISRRNTNKSTLGRSDTAVHRKALNDKHGLVQKKSWWTTFSRCLTFYAPFSLLSSCGKMKDHQVQQAFREKLALCTIIAFLMAAVAFLTFGFQSTICIAPRRSFPYNTLSTQQDVFSIAGITYFLPSTFVHPKLRLARNAIVGKDLTFLFPRNSTACNALGISRNPFTCTTAGVWPLAGNNPALNACHTETSTSILQNFEKGGQTFLPWDEVKNTSYLIVYNGQVLDITKFRENPDFLGLEIFNVSFANAGKDLTYIFETRKLRAQAECLSSIFTIAYVDTATAGCFVSNIVLYVSLAFIGGVVFIRFFIALYFGLFVGWRLGDQDRALLNTVCTNKATARKADIERKTRSRYTPKQPNDFRKQMPSNSTLNLDISLMDLSTPTLDPIMNDPSLMHTLVMVPCYSESLDSMRTTIHSIVDSDYPATHKCIFVVADGIVQGSGNNKPTFEYVIDMMDIDHRFSSEDPRSGGIPSAYSYVAIADGTKRKNLARVYVGWYKSETPRSSFSSETLVSENSSERGRFLDSGDMPGTGFTIKERKKGRVPMLLVVKVGNEEEQSTGQKKPGNRGKRDSQVILMNFLSKLMFDDRMTELEFDIFFKLWTVSGVIPDKYEAVMMVDADTKIYKSALRHLIAQMAKDPDVIGICGETRVGNKWQSWVTMIQVFEYHISHNLAKAFETCFGVVTCLPGCFSVYRVSAPKGSGFCVPILANPDIVEEYSENVVDTLHKKNLLLLGEDRYLSTLLLKAFPKRKMIYIPNAICDTVVPDEFAVLLSQRRRWINSTIHNLLELVQVRNLCGIFCFSMQFVIFMELLGTVVLPAAIVFTCYVVTISLLYPDPPVVTLALLAAILGLPGLLTVFTSGNLMHIFWMLVYLIALPIWNFVLPLYAFWHFDDFSWGETRVVLGDLKGDVHGKREGEFDGSGISMKRWEEWMIDRRIKLTSSAGSSQMQQLGLIQKQGAEAPGSPNGGISGRLNIALPKSRSNSNILKNVPILNSATRFQPNDFYINPNQIGRISPNSSTHSIQKIGHMKPLPKNHHLNQNGQLKALPYHLMIQTNPLPNPNPISYPISTSHEGLTILSAVRPNKTGNH